MASQTCPTCGSKPGYRSGPHCLGSYPDPWHDTHRTSAPLTSSVEAGGVEKVLRDALREAQNALYRASKNLQGAAAFVNVGVDRAAIHRRAGDARRAAEAIDTALRYKETNP
ncbi:MAG: hypothetical protein E6R03_03165 [Hyphomicrobiaceae bacterium]|nr:MAG: hypothetical protein E6R03_03165 [Hyphomicrobiaceae bacterium]